MKNVVKLLAAFIATGTLVSCEPKEDRDSLPAVTLTPDGINISISPDAVNPNKINLQDNTEDVIPYWAYTDAEGRALGNSNLASTTITLPFAGTYFVNYTAFTRGGRVDAAPATVVINQNDDSYFSAPEWDMLTNGAEGKTWVLDMASPIGWAGLDFPYNPDGADYWNWFPDYAGNEWVMPNKNWGEMRFDLNGGYNTTVTQTALATNDQTTKTGTYSYDIAGHTLMFNGGAELLHGGDYYPDASNWTKANVVEISDTSLRLSVLRDQSRTGEAKCQIVFHFKPKE